MVTGGVEILGVVAVGTVTDGTVTVGVEPTGVDTCGTVTEGTVTDGVVTCGVVTEGTFTAGVVTPGTLTLGSVAASPMSGWITSPASPAAATTDVKILRMVEITLTDRKTCADRRHDFAARSAAHCQGPILRLDSTLRSGLKTDCSDLHR